MLFVNFGPRRELGLIFRLDPLFSIPPGAAAVEIISNIGGADHSHISPPVRVREIKYSTNFLVFTFVIASPSIAKQSPHKQEHFTGYTEIASSGKAPPRNDK